MPRESDEGVELEIDGPVEAETQAAILVQIEGDKYWVPKSQIDDDSEVYKKGDTGTIMVSSWWAKKERLV